MASPDTKLKAKAREYKARQRKRMKEAGYVQVTVWARPVDREAIKRYATSLMLT